MSGRELVVLGTASQTPTRQRNHNGYFLRYDTDGFLFDPGEGTQRQMVHAGIPASAITRICVTHFHGDHCLGLPGVIQRLSLDRVPHPVTAHFPGSGVEYFHRLRYAASFHETATLIEQPVDTAGPQAVGDGWTLYAQPLAHPVPSFGYQLVEPERRHLIPELLAERGIAGRDIGALQRDGEFRGTLLTDVSLVRPGQRFAFVMDTALCDGVYELAQHADLLVIESTFLDSEADLAKTYGHLTAAQAGQVAAECGVRTLVLTHFSQRYQDPAAFAEEAGHHFGGDLVVAADLQRVQFPSRR